MNLSEITFIEPRVPGYEQLQNVHLEQLKSHLEKFEPYDYEVNLSPFYFRFISPYKFICEESSDKFNLTRRAFHQLVRFIHPRASGSVILDIAKQDEEFAVNFLNKLLVVNQKRTDRRNTVKLRTYSFEGENVTLAALSSSYPNISYKIIYDLILKALMGLSYSERSNSEGKLIVNADWETAFVRLPINKISNNGLGVYSGLEFSNGQVGNKTLSINALIWELICSNGMSFVRDTFTFINRKHSSKIGNEFERFPEWYQNVTNKINVEFSELTKHKINEPEKFITVDMPKKYSLVSINLAKEIYDYIIKSDSKTDITAWDLTRGITKLSQQFKTEKRLELDQWASELPYLEGWKNN